MFRSSKSGKSSSSILSADVEVYGDLKVSGSMLVYGKVFGSIESKGSIRTGKGSFVKGDVKAFDAVINGNVYITTKSYEQNIEEKEWSISVNKNELNFEENEILLYIISEKGKLRAICQFNLIPSLKNE